METFECAAYLVAKFAETSFPLGAKFSLAQHSEFLLNLTFLVDFEVTVHQRGQVWVELTTDCEGRGWHFGCKLIYKRGLKEGGFW